MTYATLVPDQVLAAEPENSKPHEGSNAYRAAWEQRVKLLVRKRIGADDFDIWMGNLNFRSFKDGVITLTVSHTPLLRFIEKRYGQQLLACWKAEVEGVKAVTIVKHSFQPHTPIAPKKLTSPDSAAVPIQAEPAAAIEGLPLLHARVKGVLDLMVQNGLVVETGPIGDDLRCYILRENSHDATDRVRYMVFVDPHKGLIFMGTAFGSMSGSSFTNSVLSLLVRIKDSSLDIHKKIPVSDIQYVVAREYGVSRSDMISGGRRKDILLPRQVAIYLAKILTTLSLRRIGAVFGNRDHTTALHSVKKIEDMLGKNPVFAEHIEMLRQKIVHVSMNEFRAPP